MSKIVAFSVRSLDEGEQALSALEDVDDVNDVALVYKNEKGRVKIRQTHDVTAGKGAVRGALLGAAVGIFTGPLVGLAAAGGAAGAAAAGVGDRGVDNKLMKLAGEQLQDGGAAVFVLAEDSKADEIASKVTQLSNLKQYSDEITVGEFPVEAEKLVKEQLKLENEAAATA